MLARAQALAAARKIAIEQMLERILHAATEHVGASQSGPHTRAALGLLKDLPNRSYKELLSDALTDKSGLDQ